MSKFFSKLKGEKDGRSGLNPSPTTTTNPVPTSSSFVSNNPYRYTATQPPAYDAQPNSPAPPQPSNTSNDDNPPPYHDWTSIPDTALLPPPPPVTSDYSSTTNASWDEATAAHAWCERHLVYNPKSPHPLLLQAVQLGQHTLDPPPGFPGQITESMSTSTLQNTDGQLPTKVFTISTIPPTHTNPPTNPKPSLGKIFGKQKPTTRPSSSTSHQNQDFTILTRLPLYFAAAQNPLLLTNTFTKTKTNTSIPRTIRFVIRPTYFQTPESTVAIGFAAKPYPPTRQPGWHRASLAIHSDDGNRYINDSWGGRPFTAAFQPGQVLEVRITFSPESPGAVIGGRDEVVLQSQREVLSRLPRCRASVEFRRDGRLERGWEIDEERDAERDEGVSGLFGEVDLYAAVGVFGRVEVEVGFFADETA